MTYSENGRDGSEEIDRSVLHDSFTVRATAYEKKRNSLPEGGQ